MSGALPGRARRGTAALALLAWAVAMPASAGETQTWTETPDSLARGQADGVAVSDGGRLFPAPRLVEIGEGPLPGEPLQVWSAASDAAGNVFFGTGPDGHVIKITPSGRREVYFTADEPLVTAVAVAPGGDLLAAAAPGGKIYRIAPDGRSTLWCETDRRYVWALAVGAQGPVFAATGEPGGVLAIDPKGRAAPLFDARESHIVALAQLGDGTLFAGGAGAGQLYQIDGDGNALVLFDDDLAEVAALAVDSDGGVVAALVAAPTPETKSPALRIRLPGGAQVTPVEDSMMAIEEQEGATVRGVIEGLPQQEDRNGARQSGRVVRIDSQGQADVVWRSTSEAPFTVIRDGSGRLLFGTGEPARVYQLESGDHSALLSTLGEAQITVALPVGRAVYLATSNPARIYRLDQEPVDTGTFLSRPFDAGHLARWGTLRWRSDGPAARTELYTRTGNSQQPDETWSAWSPALIDPDGSAIVNPDGRFLQWRARLFGNRLASSGGLGAVTVTYAPHNRPPALRDFFLESNTRAVTSEATFRWSTYDPDQDPVNVLLDYRAAGATEWTALPDGPDADGEESIVEWHDDRVKLRTALLAEGDYELRVTLSDEAGNPPGEGRRVVAREDLRLTVDRTPPVIEIRNGGGAEVEVTVSDDFSDVTAVELVLGERTRYRPRPVDGVCDSRREIFRFALPAEQARDEWTVRGIDSAGNKAEAPLSAP